jgi:hypothetical protein
MNACSTLCRAGFAAMAGLSLATQASVAAPPDVSSEELSQGLKVNGVALSVTRLSGEGLVSFAQQVGRTWIREGTAGATWADRGDWRVLSRRAGPWSEVLQIRKGPHPTEALLSRVDMSRAPTPVPPLALALPALCRVQSTVELGGTGERAIQVSARCAASVAQVGAQIRRRAQAGGWRERGAQSGSSLHLARGPVQLTLVIGRERERTADDGAWVVAFEIERLEAVP